MRLASPALLSLSLLLAWCAPARAQVVKPVVLDLYGGDPTVKPHHAIEGGKPGKVVASASSVARSVLMPKGIPIQASLSRNATMYTLFKVNSPSGGPFRIHFTDFELPWGVWLHVYTRTSDGKTSLAGAYAGKGPEYDSDFWSSAIFSGEAWLELQPGKQALKSLPFTIQEIAESTEPTICPRPASPAAEPRLDQQRILSAVGRAVLVHNGEWRTCAGIVLDDPSLRRFNLFAMPRSCTAGADEASITSTMEVYWDFLNDGAAEKPFNKVARVLPQDEGTAKNPFVLVELSGTLPGRVIPAPWSWRTPQPGSASELLALSLAPGYSVPISFEPATVGVPAAQCSAVGSPWIDERGNVTGVSAGQDKALLPLTTIREGFETLMGAKANLDRPVRLEVTSPSPGDLRAIRLPETNVAGFYQSRYPITTLQWTINGVSGRLNNPPRQWSLPNVPLDLGENVLSVSAVDVTGETQTVTVSLWRTEKPPILPEQPTEYAEVYWQGEKIKASVRNGIAYLDDMILGLIDTLTHPNDTKTLQGLVSTRNNVLWPGGRVFYTFASDVPSDTRVRVRKAAIAWNNVLNNQVSIAEAITPAELTAALVINVSPDKCEAGVGHRNPIMNLMSNDNKCGVGAIAHEFGHSLGLHHEHQRSDRETYAALLENNLAACFGSLSSDQLATNFSILGSNASAYGLYDYGSLMHYYSCENRTVGGTNVVRAAFDTRGIPTGYSKTSSATPSRADAATVLRMYGFPMADTVFSVFPELDPFSGQATGLTFSFDGQEQTGFLQVPLESTVVHQLSTKASQLDVSGQTLWGFRRWNTTREWSVAEAFREQAIGHKDNQGDATIDAITANFAIKAVLLSYVLIAEQDGTTVPPSAAKIEYRTSSTEAFEASQSWIAGQNGRLGWIPYLSYIQIKITPSASGNECVVSGAFYDDKGTPTSTVVHPDFPITFHVDRPNTVKVQFDCNQGTGLPASANNLQASAVSATRVDLAWGHSGVQITGFRIERRFAGESDFSSLAAVSSAVRNYSDVSLSAGATAYYRVIAVNGLLEAAPSNVASATTTDAVEPPGGVPFNFTGEPLGIDQIELRWSWTGGTISGFKLQRSDGNANSFYQIKTLAAGDRSFVNYALQQNSTYYYRICAYNSSGCSAWSNIISATTDSNAPFAPTNLSAALDGQSAIILSWRDNALNEDGYEVWRKDGVGGNWFWYTNVSRNATSFRDSLVGENKAYYYKVRAFNYAGTSAFSNESTIISCFPTDGPRLEDPNFDAVISGTSVTLVWDEVAGASSYDVLLDFNNPPATVVRSGIVANINNNNNSTTITNLVPGTRYYWAVVSHSACNSTVIARSFVETFSTLKGPDPVQLLKPLNNSPSTATSLVLDWTDLGGTGNYKFILRYWTGANPVVEEDMGFATEKLLTGLSVNTTYQWQVVAYARLDPTMKSTSVTWQFTTGTASATTVELLPVADASLRDGTLANQNFGFVGVSGVLVDEGGVGRGYQNHRWRYAIRFDLSSVPAGSNVTNATFVISKSGDSKSIPLPWTLYIDPFLGTWSEGSITWNFQPRIDAAARIVGSLAKSFEFRNDITSLVHQWVSGARENHGMLLTTPEGESVANQENIQYWDQRESNRFSGYPVKLIVTYSQPCGEPGSPASPSPSNATTEVPTSTTLDWNDVPNAANAKVYLGTVNPPPYKGLATGSSMGVSGLNPNTTYYWRVEAMADCNPETVTPSPIWSFRTKACAAPIAPSLTSPTLNSTGHGRTVNLSWQPSPGADYYQIYASASNPPTLAATIPATQTNFDLSTSAGATYYWKVVARVTCDEALSAESNVSAFSTAAGPTASAGISTTITVGQNTPLGGAPTASGGTAPYTYAWEVSPMTGAAISSSSAANPTLTGSEQGAYEARVRVTDAKGFVAQSSAIVTVVPPVAAPNLLTPSNGATGVDISTTLTWGAAAGASSYDVYIGTPSLPSTPTYAALTGTTKAIEGLSFSTTYVWKVVAKNGTLESSSATWSFTTAAQATPPGAVALSTPPNGAQSQPTSLTLQWAAASGATSYDVYYGTVNPPPTPIFTGVNGTSQTITGLTNGATYYWKVVAKNGAGQTASSIWSFATAATGPMASVKAGGLHTLQLKADGTVWAWGNNAAGELGDGSMVNQSTPVRVSSLTGVVAMAAGWQHSLAVRGDGTVWAWGINYIGQLGDGSSTTRSTPIQVNGLTGVVAVAAGMEHSLAVKGDGTVWAWGYNPDGRLGDGSTTNRSTPVQVSGLTGVVAVAAGWYHSLAVKGDGTVWAWGYNPDGRLGDGTTTNRTTPVQVSGLTGVVTVAAGMSHSLAVKGDGTVWAWGSNLTGQLGIGTSDPKLSPVQVIGLTEVVAVTAGQYHSLAARGDGTVWAWGLNSSGELGDGTTTNSQIPIQVTGLTGVAGLTAFSSHSVVLKIDGSVQAWGSNTFGQLGDGSTIYRSTPATVSGLTGMVTAAGGYGHSLAVKGDGTVRTWGQNTTGQLGDGTTTNRIAPVQVSGMTGVVAAAGGSHHNLVLKGDGTVWAFGHNSSGRLGDGTTTRRSAPVQVSGLTGMVAVAAGDSHSLAVNGNGSVYAWGSNSNGQLGDGSTTNRTMPVPVSGLTSVGSVAAGYFHSFAVKGDGSVWAWGSNGNGQLGDGSTTSRMTPVQVSGLTGVVAVAAGHYHGLALKADGSVWAWGFNSYGQLGDGTTTDRLTPVQVSGLTGVVAVAAGHGHSLALKSDGTVWAWGANGLGQLGDGTTTNRSTPVQVSGLTGVVAVTAGFRHTLVVKGDGTVSAWGWNGASQLGDGRSSFQTVPIVPIPIGSPDLSAGMTANVPFTVGGQGSYTITLNNVSQTAIPGTTTVSITLAPGLYYVSGTGTGWNCAAAGSTVTCANATSIGAGASSTIALVVQVGRKAYPGATSVATSSNGGDMNPLNNTAGAPVGVSPRPQKLGAYSTSYWLQDVNGNYAWDGVPTDGSFTLGLEGTPKTGDWNGSGTMKAAIYNNGTWRLDYNGNRQWDGPSVDKEISFGWAGAIPLVGDWNGDGKDEIGVYSEGFWFLDYNGDYQWDGGVSDKLIGWGWPGATPVVGDWNGNGKTKIGVYSGGFWFLDYDGDFLWNPGNSDKQVGWGWAGVQTVVGDWNGDGRTKIGVYSAGFWFLDYDGDYVWNIGAGDKQVGWGWEGVTTVLGDWNGDGKTKIGVVNQGFWFLDYDGNYVWDGGTIDKVAGWGPGWTPVPGRW